MQMLAELQSQVRNAIVVGNDCCGGTQLVGGRDPMARLAIHQRHYQASLTTALLGKFPACVWLMGQTFVSDAAKTYIHRPPSAPCIAEYGADFPAFLAGRPGADRVPYLGSFGELEWHLGCVAVAIDHQPVAIETLSAFPADRLPDLVLEVQPGIRYIAADWPVDDLMKLHLTENAPDRYVCAPLHVGIEVRGARGALQINRLDLGNLAFRRAISDRLSIGIASEQALDVQPSFDIGQALVALFAEQVVTGVDDQQSGAA